MATFNEARPFLPTDVPMIYRLTPHGVSLDSTTRLTRGINTVEGAVWSALPLADLGTPTFIIRDGEDGYVAQFRHKSGDQHAHIVFIAPDPDEGKGYRAWGNLLEAMIAHAGKRGATRLHAEAEEGSVANEFLARMGFSTYARQTIWRRSPNPLPIDPNVAWVRPATDQDAIGVSALYASLVPRMVAQAEEPPDVKHNGLVVEQEGRTLGFIAVQKGSSGIYLQPYLHVDLLPNADAILAQALNVIKGADKLPIYICVRRYQTWLDSALDKLRFEV